MWGVVGGGVECGGCGMVVIRCAHTNKHKKTQHTHTTNSDDTTHHRPQTQKQHTTHKQKKENKKLILPIIYR